MVGYKYYYNHPPYVVLQRQRTAILNRQHIFPTAILVLSIWPNNKVQSYQGHSYGQFKFNNIRKPNTDANHSSQQSSYRHQLHTTNPRRSGAGNHELVVDNDQFTALSTASSKHHFIYSTTASGVPPSALSFGQLAGSFQGQFNSHVCSNPNFEVICRRPQTVF